jgi:hypothetical protein
MRTDAEADRRKDVKLIGAFRDYAKTPKDNNVIRFWGFYSMCCLQNAFFLFLTTAWKTVPVPNGKDDIRNDMKILKF